MQPYSGDKFTQAVAHFNLLFKGVYVLHIPLEQEIKMSTQMEGLLRLESVRGGTNQPSVWEVEQEFIALHDRLTHR